MFDLKEIRGAVDLMSDLWLVVHMNQEQCVKDLFQNVTVEEFNDKVWVTPDFKPVHVELELYDNGTKIKQPVSYEKFVEWCNKMEVSYE